jgi:aspartyl-tRNA(Asn)/glutamyl-tRNA(Gln) amidotransferase subunit A
MEDEPGGSCDLDAIALSEAFSSGALSPVQAVEAVLERIADRNGDLNAVTALNATAKADAAASAARYQLGAPLGPLDGIPILVKDNLVVAGLPASWGSRVFAATIQASDELPIARLRAAGAVIVGKTNTPEFAVEGYTANALHGVTRNPWNTSLTPGGSSGGSAAAVAAGMVPLALGTDGGGSIRRPAAYTGLAGFKPSIGAVPRLGGLPQILLDFEVVGPLARTVADLAACLDVLRGPDPRDRSSLAAATALRDHRRGAPPWRILYVDRLADAPCDPEILESIGEFAANLQNLGHRVERGVLPFDVDELFDGWATIGAVGLARLAAVTPDFAALASPQYLALAQAGRGVDAVSFARLLESIGRLRASEPAVFEHIDAIVMPACAAMPWEAGKTHPETIDGLPAGPRGHAIYTGWVNAIGLPAVTLPCRPGPSGLPIGAQIIGAYGGDADLLDFARQYEAAYPWLHRRPPLLSPAHG